MSEKKLGAVMVLTDKYTPKIQKIMQSTDDAEKKLKALTGTTEAFMDELNNMAIKSNTASNALTGLASKMATVVSAGYAVKKAFDIAWGGIENAGLQNVQENTLQAMLGSDAAGTGLYDYISDYAKTSILGREDLAKGLTSFIPTTRDLSQLQKLINMTERLYAKDPTQGAEGAVFAIKEILSGDTMSMRSRYNITGFDGDMIRTLIADGKTAEAIEYISGILDKFGASMDVLEKNTDSLSAKMNILGSNAQTALGEKMEPVMEHLLPLLDQLVEDLDAGRFQPFFDTLVVGGSMAVKVLGFVADNTELVSGGIIVLTSAVGGYKIATNMATISTKLFGVSSVEATAGVWGLNTALLANPITWFVGLLALGTGAMMLFNNELDKLSNKSVSANVLEDGELDKLLKSTSQGTTLPVTVENESLAVTGTVDIEEDNIKYLLDLANRDYVAKFSTATLAPQIYANFGDVHETADVGQMLDLIEREVQSMVSIEAEGVA